MWIGEAGGGVVLGLDQKMLDRAWPPGPWRSREDPASVLESRQDLGEPTRCVRLPGSGAPFPSASDFRTSLHLSRIGLL